MNNYLLHVNGQTFYVENDNGQMIVPMADIEIVTDANTQFIEFTVDPYVANTFSKSGGDGYTVAVGDPYIQSLNGGEVWKMPNFEGYSRMLQGKVNGKQLTINVQTTISSREEAMENKEYSRKMLDSIGINMESLEKQGCSFDDKGEAFMRNLWVKYGDKEMSINMEKLTCNNNDFKTRETEEFVAFEKYECHEAKSIEVLITNKLSLIVSKYPNPQVRTGFSLRGKTKEIKNRTGVLCNKLYKKDMELKKLTSTKAIVQKKDRPARREKIEKYWNSEGKQETKTLKVY